MVFWFDADGNVLKSKKTLADKELDNDYYNSSFTVNIAGMKIPVWKVVEKFLKIKDERGRNVPLELMPHQIKFYKKIVELHKKGEPLYLIVLKARQEGFSTIISAILFVRTLFIEGQTATIVADTTDHATGLFDKYKFFYENLPKSLKKLLPKEKENGKYLKILHGSNYSQISIVAQGKGAGRSMTNTGLHASETAFWDDIDDTFQSILETVAIDNKEALVVVETTANGYNEFKTLWDSAVAGKSESIFTPFFSAWYEDPRNAIKYEDNPFELSLLEKDLMETHSLNLNQIAWYHFKYLQVKKNFVRLRTENPTTPEEAFQTSGSSIFSPDLLKMAMERARQIKILIPDKKYLEEEKKSGLYIMPFDEKFKRVGTLSCDYTYSSDGNNISVKNIAFKDKEEGELTIYESAKQGHPYIVSLDPAEFGADDSVIQVIDNSNLTVVATLKINGADYKTLGFNLFMLGTIYNNALVVSETNRVYLALEHCFKCGYDNFYVDENKENIIGLKVSQKLGFKTTVANRDALIQNLQNVFNENPYFTKDIMTLSQMSNFQEIKVGTREGVDVFKKKASGAGHDDTVMALAIGLYVRNQQTSLIDKQSVMPIKKATLYMFENDKAERRVKNNFYKFSGIRF